MAMKSNAQKQKGFTIVELSIVLVVVGLLFAAVVRGQQSIDTAKAQKLVSDMKNVVALVEEHKTRHGRLPGDCDADGIIDADVGAVSRVEVDNLARATFFNYTNTSPAKAASAAAPASGTAACAEVGGIVDPGTTGTTGNNVWLNDLKTAGLVPVNTPNRLLAKQVNEDFLFVGKVIEASAGSSAAAGEYNAIVVHNVPAWMARAAAKAINGGDDSAANYGRLRSLDRTTTTGVYDARWDTQRTASESATSNRDNMVSIVYYFDNVPSF
jgi:prepilin-type N-terminal cleavage/methylation domain-containing protein